MVGGDGMGWAEVVAGELDCFRVFLSFFYFFIFFNIKVHKI